MLEKIKFYKVIDRQANFRGGHILLTADQARARKHVLLPVSAAGRVNLFEMLPQQNCSFKAGEILGLGPDVAVNKRMLAQISAVDLPELEAIYPEYGLTEAQFRAIAPTPPEPEKPEEPPETEAPPEDLGADEIAPLTDEPESNAEPTPGPGRPKKGKR